MWSFVKSEILKDEKSIDNLCSNYEDINKAVNAINNKFISIFSQPSTLPNKTLNCVPPTNIYITENEVFLALTSIKCNKASGSDGIPANF